MSSFAFNSASIGDDKIDGHHFSASKFPILPIVHGSCVMDECVSDQGEGIITSYLVVVVLSCSSNLFLLFY